MPTKAAKKRAAKTAGKLRDQLRKTAEQMWSDYDPDFWWDFDPIQFAPPRARPFLEDARRSFLLATRELLNTWIETAPPTRRSSGRPASARRTAARRSPRRVRVRP